MQFWKKRIAKLLIFVMCFTSIGFMPAGNVWGSESNGSEDKSTVTVYLSISEDGAFVTGNDSNKTVVSHVPVTVEYFDLAEYGLEDFYRYESDAPENGGNYIGDTVIKQPTVLHLIIRAIEQYYLGGKKLEVGGEALNITGSATSMYMKNFWGHDENLMYFIDHAYPLMRAGWGATADYILLEDGMEIDIAMFSDWEFYTYGAFAYFTPTAKDVAVGESVTLQMKGVSTHEDVNGKNSVEQVMANEDVVFAEAGDAVNGYSNGQWEAFDAVTDENGEITVSFDKPGTYYVSSTPYYETFPGEGELPCVAPPIATIHVSGEEGEEDQTGTENLKVLSGLRFTEKTANTSADYTMTPAFDAETDTYTVYVPDQTDAIAVWGNATAEALATAATSKITATYKNLDGEEQSFTKSTDANSGLNLPGLLEKGEAGGTLTLTGTCGKSSQTYTVQILRVPTLASLEVTDENQTSLPFDQSFAAGTHDYEVSVPADTKTLNLKMAGTDDAYTICVDGKTVTADGTAIVEMTEDNPQKIEIVVTGTQGQTTTYTVTIDKKKTVNCTFTGLLSGMTVQITDHRGDDVCRSIVEDTTLAVPVQEDETYTYKLSLKGYETKTGTFTAGETDFIIDGTLVKLDENTSIDATISSMWPSFRNDQNNNGVTSAKTPVTAAKTQLLWAMNKGGGWSGAPSSPILVDDELIFTTNAEIVKIDRVSGKLVQSSPMVSKSAFSLVPPTYAEGMIFVALAGGRVQAFNAKTLESLWVYQDPLGGQPNSPILYHDGYVYTGFWNSETEKANYVGILAADENLEETTEAKTAAWTHTHVGGYYWAGAIGSANAILVGSDNGTNDESVSTGSLYAFQPTSGKVLDQITDIDGDIRSSIVYDETLGTYHFVSRGGSFYSVKLNEAGTFDRTSLKKIALGGSATSTPVVYNGRAYVGVSGSSNLGAYSGHKIVVIDLEKQTIAYDVPTRGYPQASGILTNGYESETGSVYVYFVENYTPGIIRVLEDKAGQTNPILHEENGGILGEREADDYKDYADTLFTPRGEQANFAIGSMIVDEYGTMYFKNDSSYIMALGNTIESIEVTKKPDKSEYEAGELFDPTGMEVTAHLSNGMARDITKYVTYPTEALAADDLEVEITFPYVMYNDKEKKSDHPTTYITIASITPEEVAQVRSVMDLIDQIKTASDQEAATIAARTAFNQLGTKLQKYVKNEDVLIDYELGFAETNLQKGAPDGVTLEVEVVDYQALKLTWSKNEYADGYAVYRSTTEGQTGSLIKTVKDKETTTLTNSGLTAGKTYYYTIRPYILVDGEKSGTLYSPQVAGCTVMSIPVLQAEKNAANSIKLTWGQVSGATGYKLYRNDGSGYEVVKTFARGTDVSYVDQNLTTGKTYQYQLTALRNDVESQPSEEVSVYLETALGTVTGVKATRSGYTSVTISWSKVKNADGYQVYRYNKTKKKYVLVKTVKSGKTCSFQNTGLKTGTSYSYKVRAYKADAVGAFSKVVSAKPTLSAVKNFKATAKTKKVKLTWSKTSGANGYVVYRSTTKTGTYKLVKTVKSGKTTSFVNTNLKSGKKYYYKIKAYRTVDGKKVYSTSYAGPKFVKVK